MLNQSHHIECSLASTVAVQSLSWLTAYTKNTATDNIDPSVVDDRPFDWKDFSFPTFTYNSETIEADILGWAFDINNTVRVSGLDSTYAATTGNSYYTNGRYIPPTYISVTLHIRPYGRNAFELIRTALEKYATDLDLTVLAKRTADRDQVTFTHDKLYCSKFDIASVQTPDTTEEYFMRMWQLNTGSFVPVTIDDYIDDYYET
jgi:hypothetical protein